MRTNFASGDPELAIWANEYAKDVARAVKRENEACARIVEDAPDGGYVNATAAQIRARSPRPLIATAKPV